jgi:hypothetical protein
MPGCSAGDIVEAAKMRHSEIGPSELLIHQRPSNSDTYEPEGRDVETVIHVLRQSSLVPYARIAGNIKRERLSSIISIIVVLIASISMVLIAGNATGMTIFGSDITPVATTTTSQ